MSISKLYVFFKTQMSTLRQGQIICEKKNKGMQHSFFLFALNPFFHLSVTLIKFKAARLKSNWLNIYGQIIETNCLCWK